MSRKVIAPLITNIAMRRIIGALVALLAIVLSPLLAFVCIAWERGVTQLIQYLRDCIYGYFYIWWGIIKCAVNLKENKWFINPNPSTTAKP